MIRTASVDDLDRLVLLAELMAAESPSYSAYTLDIERVRRTIEAMINSPDATVLITEDGTGMLGAYVGQLPWFTEKFAFEAGFFVIQEMRGTRRAIELIRGFETWAASMGVKEIKIGTSTGVHHDKTTSIFTRLGYRLAGESFKKEI